MHNKPFTMPEITNFYINGYNIWYIILLNTSNCIHIHMLIMVRVYIIFTTLICYFTSDTHKSFEDVKPFRSNNYKWKEAH